MKVVKNPETGTDLVLSSKAATAVVRDLREAHPKARAVMRPHSGYYHVDLDGEADERGIAPPPPKKKAAPRKSK